MMGIFHRTTLRPSRRRYRQRPSSETDASYLRLLHELRNDCWRAHIYMICRHLYIAYAHTTKTRGFSTHFGVFLQFIYTLLLYAFVLLHLDHYNDGS